MITTIMLAGLALCAFAHPSHASCSKPDAPWCASDDGRFEDRRDFARCKNEMDRYQIDIDSFLSCQRREIQEALDDYDETVARFNRRATPY